MAFLKALFGDYSTKEIKRIRPLCDKVLALEETYAAMSEDELRGHPVILIRGIYANSSNSSSSGHVTVVYGYTSYNGSRYYLINDPWPADSDPWPESNPGQSLKWKYSKIANQAISDDYTYKLVGIISK